MIYLAGPLSGARIEEHCTRAVEVYLQLVALGYPVYCPHLGHPLDDVGISEDQWLSLGMYFLKRSKVVLMLPGWGNSRGAVAEMQQAIEWNIPIVHDIYTITIWYKPEDM